VMNPCHLKILDTGPDSVPIGGFSRFGALVARPRKLFKEFSHNIIPEDFSVTPRRVNTRLEAVLSFNASHKTMDGPGVDI